MHHRLLYIIAQTYSLRYLNYAVSNTLIWQVGDYINHIHKYVYICIYIYINIFASAWWQYIYIYKYIEGEYKGII